MHFVRRSAGTGCRERPRPLPNWVGNRDGRTLLRVGVEFERIRGLGPLGDAVRLDDVEAIDGLGGLIADRRGLWSGSDDGTLWHIDLGPVA